MKELSQNPDYETIWKVECELNKELQDENKTLREALEYYAKRMGSGRTAREALAKVKE